MEAAVNRPETAEYTPVASSDGTLYFAREAGPAGGSAGPDTKMDLYIARPAAGGFAAPVRLGDEINSPYHDLEPAITPDGIEGDYYWVDVRALDALRP